MNLTRAQLATRSETVAPNAVFPLAPVEPARPFRGAVTIVGTWTWPMAAPKQVLYPK